VLLKLQGGAKVEASITPISRNKILLSQLIISTVNVFPGRIY
jgi:hypothetical protein